MRNAGIKGQTKNTTEEEASGIWTINDVMYGIKESLWPDNERPLFIEYLVVAGGGAGGADGHMDVGNGGGGAGGYRTNYTSAGSVSIPKQSGGGAAVESSFNATPGTAYTVTVGAGGAGSTIANEVGGSNSVFATITSIGGGGGGYYINNAGGSGGSGGGGSDTASGGSGTSGQGYAGGAGLRPPSRGGGGGGAGAAGINLIGGEGVLSDITGSATQRAGGGGGTETLATGGSGGAGGGGQAADGSSAGVSGTALTGSGGGGGRSNLTSGSGGSGIVILKYPNTFTIYNPGGGLTFTTFTDVPGFKVTTFTAGTGNIQFS